MITIQPCGQHRFWLCVECGKTKVGKFPNHPPTCKCKQIMLGCRSLKPNLIDREVCYRCERRFTCFTER